MEALRGGGEGGVLTISIHDTQLIHPFASNRKPALANSASCATQQYFDFFHILLLLLKTYQNPRNSTRQRSNHVKNRISLSHIISHKPGREQIYRTGKVSCFEDSEYDA